jgi:hypothetical protein
MSVEAKAATPGAHTPGPWYVDIYNNILHKGEMVAFACISGGYPEKANARLIAAAPEMLEALEMLIDRTANPITDHAFYTLEDARSKGRAAIRVAREGR